MRKILQNWGCFFKRFSEINKKVALFFSEKIIGNTPRAVGISQFFWYLSSNETFAKTTLNRSLTPKTFRFE